jgi:hypothetical protein
MITTENRSARKWLSSITAIVLVFTVAIADAQSYGGFTLYSKMNSTKAVLLDSAGLPYHEWTFPSNRRTAYATHMEPGGTLVRSVSGSNSSFTGAAAISVAVQKVDWDGMWCGISPIPLLPMCCIMTFVRCRTANVLVIAYERMTAAEVTQAGCTLNNVMYFEKIMEIEPNGASAGNIVWEWRVFDHLVQDVDSTKNNYVTNTADYPHKFNVNYKPKRDWMHINSVDYNPVLEQVVFTARYMGELYVVDKSTTTAEAAGNSGGQSGKGGSLLYRWGNPEAYGATGTRFIELAHDAHWIPPGFPYAGHISYFNNKGGVGNKTCVDIILPPYNGYQYHHTPGNSFGPATYTWRHTYSGTAADFMGGAQPLDNGNFLVTLPTSGHIYEVDPSDNVVWTTTVGGSVPKARRYSKAWVEGTLDIHQAIPKTMVSVFPNPSNGLFTIHGVKENTTIQVTDLTSKTQYYTIYANSLNLTHLPPGIYLITLPQNPEQKGIKVIITP